MSKTNKRNDPLLDLERQMFSAALMLDVAVPQKSADLIPYPAGRSPGWITYRDRVAFVILDYRGKPRIRTGHIASWPGSHGAGMEVDNVNKTVVWCDQTLNDLADDADDAHEQSFNPKDPRLIRLDEVSVFQDAKRAAIWFGNTYPERVAKHIGILFTMSDFGRSDELQDSEAAQKIAIEAARREMGWYGEDGQFHPPVRDDSTVAAV